MCYLMGRSQRSFQALRCDSLPHSAIFIVCVHNLLQKMLILVEMSFIKCFPAAIKSVRHLMMVK